MKLSDAQQWHAMTRDQKIDFARDNVKVRERPDGTFGTWHPMYGDPGTQVYRTRDAAAVEQMEWFFSVANAATRVD